MKSKKATARPEAPASSGAQVENSPTENAKEAAVQGEYSPAMHAKKQPRGLSRMLLAVCTGVLALAFSAVPALSLWLNDTQLLAQPHERTGQAGALALTSDDLYLTRILKKSSQRDAFGSGYTNLNNLTNPVNMNWTSNEEILDLLNTVYEAGILPAELWSYCSEHITQSFAASDNLGFVYYIAYGMDSIYISSEYHYVVGFTVENESQKVVGMYVSVPPGFEPPAVQKQALLEAYRDYLELDVFERWEDPADTFFAGSALYSPGAEAMLFCDTGSYRSHAYNGPQISIYDTNGNDYDRSYYCLNAFSYPEETVRGWQEYTRSFPAGTDVWHRGYAAEDADAEFAAGEEALG